MHQTTERMQTAAKPCLMKRVLEPTQALERVVLAQQLMHPQAPP
jgi:hypothetical protein